MNFHFPHPDTFSDTHKVANHPISTLDLHYKRYSTPNLAVSASECWRYEFGDVNSQPFLVLPLRPLGDTTNNAPINTRIKATESGLDPP